MLVGQDWLVKTVLTSKIAAVYVELRLVHDYDKGQFCKASWGNILQTFFTNGLL